MILSSHSPIQRSKSLYEQVYEALRTNILTGVLTPGDRLVETQLAEWLSVSRTPLREALRQLQKEGLATADAAGGLRVTTLSTTDAIELYDCRLALEQFSVTVACQQISHQQLKTLESYVNQAEMLSPQPNHSEINRQLLDLDYQFHRLIAESTGNKRLVSMLVQLFNAMALLRVQTLQHNPQVLDIRREHRAVYDAIADHDIHTATTAIRTHLIASKTRVVQEIQSLYQTQSSIDS